MISTLQRLSQMAAKLKRFLLRYFPPGIILEYETDGVVDQKTVDLLTLSVDTDVEVLLSQIVRHEPLISESRKPQLRKLVYKLIEKQVRARERGMLL
jgi:dynein assembly factor with WDR repeat domains 1